MGAVSLVKKQDTYQSGECGLKRATLSLLLKGLLLIAPCCAVITFPEVVSAQACQTRQFGETCTINLEATRVYAGHTRDGEQTRTSPYTVPQGYVVVGFQKHDRSTNAGTFEVEYVRGGSRIEFARSDSGQARTLNDYRGRVEAQDSSGRAEAEVLQRELNEISNAFSQASSYETNVDTVRLTTRARYQCDFSAFGTCVEGRGSTGEGHITLSLFYVGTAGDVDARLNSIGQRLSALERNQPSTTQTSTNRGIIPEGAFQFNGRDPIYYSNGTDGYCWYRGPADFERLWVPTGRDVNMISGRLSDYSLEYHGHCGGRRGSFPGPHPDREWHGLSVSDVLFGETGQ